MYNKVNVELLKIKNVYKKTTMNKCNNINVVC